MIIASSSLGSRDPHESDHKRVEYVFTQENIWIGKGLPSSPEKSGDHDGTGGRMKCPKCGTENFIYVRFCTKCGYDFFSPAIEDIGVESVIETDPLPKKKTAPLPNPKPKREGYPFDRVMMITITTFLVAGGIGLIGGVIGYIRNTKDRLKGALIGSTISAIIIVVLLILDLTLGPLLGSINFSGINLSNIHLPRINFPVIKIPDINLSNLLPNPSTTPGIQVTPFPSPTAMITAEPTPTCSSWDLITPTMKGTSVCVSGNAVTVYPITGNMGNTLTRINFSTAHNTFFLLSRDDFFSNTGNATRPLLKNGDCIQVTAIVKILDDGTHQTPYMQIKEIFPCSK